MVPKMKIRLFTYPIYYNRNLEVLTGLPPVSSIWIPWLSLTFSALFPDFPWPHDTDLMGIAWNPGPSEEKFCTCNHWDFTKMCLEIRDQLWVISARSFSLTFPDSQQKILKFPDFPWLSRRSKFSLIFHDFPWWWQPCFNIFFMLVYFQILTQYFFNL